jgi:hypothetical protein
VFFQTITERNFKTGFYFESVILSKDKDTVVFPNIFLLLTLTS